MRRGHGRMRANKLRAGRRHRRPRIARRVRTLQDAPQDAVLKDRIVVPRRPGLVLSSIPRDPFDQRRLPSPAVRRSRHPIGRQGADNRCLGHMEDSGQLVPVDIRDHRRHGRAPCVHGGHPEPRHPVHPQDAVVRGRGQRRDPRGAGGHAHDPRLQRRGASDP